jgi:hypothetical protein
MLVPVLRPHLMLGRDPQASRMHMVVAVADAVGKGRHEQTDDQCQ